MNTKPQNFGCPLPIQKYNEIIMAHGSGGRLTQELIQNLFLPAFNNDYLDQGTDSSVIDFGDQKIAFTTDSHVIQPLFFPGGDIGSLAVYGTCNDLAMSGAKPKFLSLGLILGEGLETKTLWEVTNSIQTAAQTAGVQIVTGDTKVIESQGRQELLINTSGIGIIEHHLEIAPNQIRNDDTIIISGDIARHGMAVMAKREALALENSFQSDCTTLWPMVEALLNKEIPIHCMRDCTRGGLATALIEIAQTSQKQFTIQESNIPVQSPVQGLCELLGIDPLYVANEGCFVLFTDKQYAQNAIDILHEFDQGKNASIIGFVDDNNKGILTGINEFGGKRILDLQTGDQLPRIC